ncbi:hypothetical protein N9213_02195 [Akkermansiaceae bacterium]|nr:hypothetical protein [Akkermansiaceae bacterium]
MNPSQTDRHEEQVPTELSTGTYLGELPLFIFLASLANPFAFFGPFRFAEILLCLGAWFVLSKRYSIFELCKQLGRPPARLLRWIYFGVLVVTGSQIALDLEPNLLRPARYSVYHYAYGIVVDYDDEGRPSASASHVITKGPYRLNGARGYDGHNDVPDEVDGAELDGGSRDDFFFWQASGTEKAKNSVSLPVRGAFYLLNELVSYTLPDFILMSALLIALWFHPKGRPAHMFLAKALKEHRITPM